MKKVIIIPHTHWDREWYFTEKKFKDRLVRVLDNVLEHLEKHPEFTFQMDGQTAPILDYLSRRPKKKKKIKKFVKEKRLFIGPSFVLPDEFLASGESLIRNLEYGIEKAKEFGGYYKVGYFPDTFGHTGQLPQILTNFGLDNICFWRGIPSNTREERNVEWVGSDGSHITGYRCDRTYNIGYSNFCGIIKKDGKFKVRQGESLKDLDEVLNSEFSKSATHTIALMNGSDHTDVHKNIVEIVKELNKKYCDIKFCFGSFEEYFNNLKKSCVTPKKIFLGELNKGTETTFLLNGTLSTRIRDVKQPYTECNLKLLRAEFAQTIAKKLTNVLYDEEALKEAWQYLLLNMPHDSLCGCSIDRVHEDMTYRFNQARDVTGKLIENSINTIADEVDTNFIRDNSLAFVVLNDSSFGKENFRTRIKLPEGFGNFGIYNSLGKKVDYHVISRKKSEGIEEKVLKDKAEMKLSKSEVLEVIVKDKIPSLGYSTFEIRKVENKKVGEKKNNLGKVLKNEHMIVEINFNGSFNIKDVTTGEVYPNCNLFFDYADSGDEYTFSPIEKDIYVTQGVKTKIKTVFDNKIGSCIKLEYDMKIPKSLSKDRKKRSDKGVKCELASYITLLKGSKKLDIVTEFENKAKDHRLRVQFPTYLKSDYSYASGHFEIVKRLAKEGDSNLEGKVEVESNSYPNQGFFAMHDGEKGLGIITKGLPEYEVAKSKDGLVSGELTLLRCVGWLSRDDLLTRKGHAGPPVETPNAQQLGKHNFEYSILLLDNKGWVGELYKGRDEIESLDSAVTSKHKGILSNNFSFIRLPKGLQYSSLRMKDDKILLRVYNPTYETVYCGHNFFSKATKVDLNGKEYNHKRCSVGPKKFLTLKLE